MQKKKILDLFCCEGGAAMGYFQAGFEVVGVDNKHQKRYPFTFICDDAIDYLIANAHRFDAIHASPPCQHYSSAVPKEHQATHPDLIRQVRFFCKKTKKPYIIENVNGAKKFLQDPVLLCGTMFDLPIYRHRYFELSWSQNLQTPPHGKHDFRSIVVTGNSFIHENGKRVRAGERLKHECAEAMQTHWMTREGMSQAIPPAYTKFLGEQLLKHLICQTTK